MKDTLIDSILNRGVANIIPSKELLEKRLHSNDKLNIYFGVDPTATHLHLGNATHLRRLHSFAQLGHNVTFLIGDFTALIGDTSDKTSERPVLTYSEIQANFKTYKSQAEKLLDFSKVKIVHNSEWLKKLTFEDILKLTRHFSLNDFISRELIKKRLTEGGSVSLPETLYPIMQGYDSYMLDTDIQIGATDQTFNMQAGRTLQKDIRNKESFVLASEFLEGTDGRKMSKSWGNAIWLDDSPNDMYGKVMSLKDDLIHRYFLLATNLAEAEIPTQGHPMELKKRLAHQIVTELHSASDAQKAQQHFESVHQQGQTPTDMLSIHLKPNTIITTMVESGLVSSNSEARRLIQQGGVMYDNQKITDIQTQINSSGVLQIGPRKFIKIIVD